jgi:hypothetical protein
VHTWLVEVPAVWAATGEVANMRRIMEARASFRNLARSTVSARRRFPARLYDTPEQSGFLHCQKLIGGDVAWVQQLRQPTSESP